MRLTTIMWGAIVALPVLVACSPASEPQAKDANLSDSATDDRSDAPAASTSNASQDGGAAALRTATRCVKDPVSALNGLDDHGAMQGFYLNGREDPTQFRHWEGIQRLDGGDGRYLVVSRIGEDMFDVVEMASRATGGKAFGASRSSSGAAPPKTDKIVAGVKQDSGFEHAGGMQAIGDVLAVPLENGSASRVVFFDMTKPASPVRLGTIERETIGEAGTASVAPLADGGFLLVVGRKDAAKLDFYTSKGKSISPPEFALDATWSKSGGVGSELSDDDDYGDYQNLNLVSGCDGALYLLGTHRSGTVIGNDYVDLFRVDLSPKPALVKVAKRHLYCSVSGDAQCNLDAAAGAYVASDGSLHLYATEHDNDGPSGSIKMMEF